MRAGGALQRAEYDSASTYRRYWDQYITRSAFQHGLVPVYWDSGSTANHASGLFDRATGAQVHADVINAVVHAAK